MDPLYPLPTGESLVFKFDAISNSVQSSTFKKRRKLMITRRVLSAIFAAISILLFAGSIHVYAGEVRGVTKDTIRMGHISDMTGPTASTERFLAEGVRNYSQYVNNKGGINGRKLKVIFEDDRYNIPAALAAFKKLVYRDKIFAFIGAGSTGGTTSLFRHIAKEKTPMFNYPVSDIVYLPPKRYVFGHGLTSQDEVRTIYHYILNVLKVKDPKIAVIYPDTEYGKYGRDTARERSKKFGLKLIEEILAIGSLDATSQVLSLKRAKPDYIILHGPPSFAAALMRDARKFGLPVKLFIATYFGADDVTVKMAKKAAKNFLGTSNVCTWYDKSPGAEKMRGITKKLHPKVPDSHYARLYTLGWLAAVVMTEGMERAGTNLNSESMVEALESIKALDTKGLCGPISFGPNDRQGMKYTKFFKADVENNAIVPITDWIKYVKE